MRGFSPRATVLRSAGTWMLAPLRDGALSMRACEELADKNGRDHWILGAGRRHEIDDSIAAELDRDGFGKWLSEPPLPTVTRRERVHESPKNPDASIAELRAAVAELQEQVAEILALLKRPNRRKAS